MERHSKFKRSQAFSISSHKETVITRLRLGTYLTNEYLSKVNVVESDKCDKYNDSVGTVHRLLLGCPNTKFQIDCCRDYREQAGPKIKRFPLTFIIVLTYAVPC